MVICCYTAQLVRAGWFWDRRSAHAASEAVPGKSRGGSWRSPPWSGGGRPARGDRLRPPLATIWMVDRRRTIPGRV